MPKIRPKAPGKQAQEDFIRDCERHTSALLAEEKVVFVDSVRPVYQSRPGPDWILTSERPAIRSTTGRQNV